jgi:hypothetical protein
MAAIGTRKLKIEVGGTERRAEVTSAKVTSGAADEDTVTFAEAEGGGSRDYNLEIILLQDAASGTLWTDIFDNAGDDATVTLMPYGNAVATVAEPHFEVVATITEPDGDLLGGAANRSKTARNVITVVWPCDAKPTKITA